MKIGLLTLSRADTYEATTGDISTEFLLYLYLQAFSGERAGQDLLRNPCSRDSADSPRSSNSSSQEQDSFPITLQNCSLNFGWLVRQK